MQLKLDAALPVGTAQPAPKPVPVSRPLRYLKMFLIGSASIGALVYTAYKTTQAPVATHQTTVADSAATVTNTNADTNTNTITYDEKISHTLPGASRPDSTTAPSGIAPVPLTTPQQAAAHTATPGSDSSDSNNNPKGSAQPGSITSTDKRDKNTGTSKDNKTIAEEHTITREEIAAVMQVPPAGDSAGQSSTEKHPPVSGAENNINIAAINMTSPRLELRTLRVGGHNAAAIHPPTNPVAWKSKTRGHAFMNWQVMLQWQFPLPAGGGKQYFNGPAGTPQAYRNFVPGLRIQNNWNNSGITLDLNAFAMQPGKDELYTLEGKKDTGRYTITGVYLTKKFGYSAAIQYQHNITRNWHAAAGLQVFRWTEASTTKEVYESTNPPIIRDSAYVPPIYARKISQTTLQLTAELMYDAPRWQSGIRVGVPFNRKDSTGVKVKTPVQVELLFRFRLWQRNKK